MAKKTPPTKGTWRKAPARRPAGWGTATKRGSRRAVAKTLSNPRAATAKSNGRQAKAPAGPAVADPPAKIIKSPLSRKELAEFREMLLVKRRQLLGDMSGMEAEAFRHNRHDASSDLSTMPVHMADIGTDNYEQEFTLGLLESERQLLREIDQALERIENGTYGVCLGTGEPIALPRLRAKPWAKYCINYARMIEQGLVRQPGQEYGGSAKSEDGDEPFEEAEEEEADVDIDDELAAQEAEDDLRM